MTSIQTNSTHIVTPLIFNVKLILDKYIDLNKDILLLLEKNDLKKIQKKNIDIRKTLKKLENYGGKLVQSADNKLQTEVRGKEFERAICLYYDTPYIGKYKYSIDNANKLVPYLTALNLISLFPDCYHSAEKGNRYDFTSTDSTTNNKYLSAKTTKKDGKVAPPVIGQSRPEKFCNELKIPYTDNLHLKKYIQENINMVISKLEYYTFDCPIIYYNEHKKLIRFIKKTGTILWNNYEKIWTCSWNEWNNSSSLNIRIDNKYIPILEFQFHSKSRTNMAIRWSFENVLRYFNNYFTINEVTC